MTWSDDAHLGKDQKESSRMVGIISLCKQILLKPFLRVNVLFPGLFLFCFALILLTLSASTVWLKLIC